MNEEAPEKKIITSFMDLHVWQEGHALVLAIYKVTRSFPKEELFGLVSQIRRAAVSVTSNLAEGFGRQSYKEKAQFFFLSRGSLTETQNQLVISKDIGYLSTDEFTKLFAQSIKVHKILTGLIKKTKSFIHS